MTARIPVRHARYVHAGRGSHCYLPAILWGRFSTCGGFLTRRSGMGTEPSGRVENPPQVENLPHIRHFWPLSRRFGVGTGQIGGAPC